MTYDSPFDDERISAYLDDELSPPERQAFERLLAERADYQNALEDLLAMRQALRSLPREALPRPLSEHVLQMAERAMLTGMDSHDSDARVAHASLTDRANVWRRIAWPLIALAAAFLVWVLGPEIGINRGGSPLSVATREEPLTTVEELPTQSAAEVGPTDTAIGGRTAGGELLGSPLQRAESREETSLKQGPREGASATAAPPRNALVQDADAVSAAVPDAAVAAGPRSDNRGALAPQVVRQQPAGSDAPSEDVLADDSRNATPGVVRGRIHVKEPLPSGVAAGATRDITGRLDATAEVIVPDQEAVDRIQEIWTKLGITSYPLGPDSYAPAMASGLGVEPPSASAPQWAADADQEAMFQWIEAEPAQWQAAQKAISTIAADPMTVELLSMDDQQATPARDVRPKESLETTAKRIRPDLAGATTAAGERTATAGRAGGQAGENPTQTRRLRIRLHYQFLGQGSPSADRGAERTGGERTEDDESHDD